MPEIEGPTHRYLGTSPGCWATRGEVPEREYSATATVIVPAILIVCLLSRYVGVLTDRCGAGLPLVIGPAIAAVGFALFAVPGVEGGSYWTSFFPAAVVLGVGLAAQASAVTTVALDSVDAGRSGLASAINNAFSQLVKGFRRIGHAMNRYRPGRSPQGATVRRGGRGR